MTNFLRDRNRGLANRSAPVNLHRVESFIDGIALRAPHKTASGRSERYRRDAQVQTRAAAEAEHRRLLVKLSESGTLKKLPPSPEELATKSPYTFAEAVRYYRRTTMQTKLKPSTRSGYNRWFDSVLLPRFGELPLVDVGGRQLLELDAELVGDELEPSTRNNVHCAFRSVLRCAVAAGFLEHMPRLPSLPKIGRKLVRPMRREHIEQLLAASPPAARMAFALMAFAGLRPCEVRGLRWTDVDFKSGVLTVRRGVVVGEETTPKSYHHRSVPLAEPLRELLEPASKQKKDPWADVALTARGNPWGDWELHQAFQRVRDKLGFSSWTPRSLRHFFVTELFALRVSAPVVQKLAGHSDLATTQLYADVDASDLRGAIAKFNGNDANGNGVETARSRPSE